MPTGNMEVLRGKTEQLIETLVQDMNFYLSLEDYT